MSELTGVPTATLRAWERRYGFPTPGRSASAYRLYTEHDVELVQRMKQLVASGIAPHEAAQQVLAGKREVAVAALDPSVDPFTLATARIVSAAEKLDATELSAELRRAMMLDSGVVAFERILRPAMIEIGTRWHAGEISIASEHFASHLIASTTLDLLRAVSVPSDAPTIVLGCLETEQHVLPLYGAALELATWGYRPLLLGARTPPTAIARARAALAPDLIGLSATIPPGPPSAAREIMDAYADACLDVPLLVGGAAADALAPFAAARGAHVMPADADSRRKLVEQVLAGRRRPSPTPVAAAPKPRRRRVR